MYPLKIVIFGSYVSFPEGKMTKGFASENIHPAPSSKHWVWVYAPFPSPVSNVSTPQTLRRGKGG